MKEKQYTDFDVMCKEMRDYLLENEGMIIAGDSPLERKHAYYHRETEQIFSIKISDLMASARNMKPDHKSCLIIEALKTHEGRNALCNAINNIEELKQADAVGNVKGNQ